MPGAITLEQPYFERADPRDNRLDEMLVRGRYWLGRQMMPLDRRGLRRFALAAEREAAAVADLSDAALREAATTLRARMVRAGAGRDLMVRAFALTREACARQIGLRHYRVQLMGGAAMLRRCIAEMETGEGNTITALLPAAALA